MLPSLFLPKIDGYRRWLKACNNTPAGEHSLTEVFGFRRLMTVHLFPSWLIRTIIWNSVPEDKDCKYEYTFFLMTPANYFKVHSHLCSPLAKNHKYHILYDSEVSLKKNIKMLKNEFIFSFGWHTLTASVWMGCTAKNSAVTKASRQSLNTALSQVYISTRVTRQCKITFTAWK